MSRDPFSDNSMTKKSNRTSDIASSVSQDLGVSEHFSSIRRIFGSTRDSMKDNNETSNGFLRSLEGDTRVAIAFGVFIFGALGMSVSLYYRSKRPTGVFAAPIRSHGKSGPMRTRTAAEALRAQASTSAQQEWSAAEALAQSVHSERLNMLVNRWQTLLVRHQQRHPLWYLSEQLLIDTKTSNATTIEKTHTEPR